MLNRWLRLGVSLVALGADVDLRRRLRDERILFLILKLAQQSVTEHVIGVLLLRKRGRCSILEVQLVRQDLIQVVQLLCFDHFVIVLLHLVQEIGVAGLIRQSNLAVHELRELKSVRQHFV